ncbi:hypothetical protein FXF51_38840 [Nonomuraea sp. PA05]|uniref:hypothetical protein n=1 Tax=Nonomuraea sp. PA05 TaxID=2604466 RepID=UPI0011D91F81|nr:hypothetical protein [Nonomuraea sp. PA05]TYB57806.1 hypothetical protein FXF51_38840 [Nonomuraea sp. PA05]
MASLLNSLIDNISIDLGESFLITEMTNGEITGDPGPGDIPPNGNPDIRVGPSGLLLTSRVDQGDKHFVRYELWDACPDAPGFWDEIWTGELHIDSGTIAIAEWNSWSEPKDFAVFDLGEAGLTWPIRVLTKVMSNTEEPDFPEDVFMVQLYRLQLWRAPATEAAR